MLAIALPEDAEHVEEPEVRFIRITADVYPDAITHACLHFDSTTTTTSWLSVCVFVSLTAGLCPFVQWGAADPSVF